MADGHPIHVLHVVPGLLPGGMETAMARVIRGLADRDMRHSVACLTGEPIIRDQFPADVTIHCLHARPNEPALPWRLRRLLAQVRPTVIHARNWGAWPDVAVARLTVWPPVPLIFSFHGFVHPGPIPRRRRIAFAALARLTTCLMTVSEASKQMLVKEMGWPDTGIEVIANGVDTDRFAPAPAGADRRSSDRIVIGTVGNLTPIKNQSALVSACADLATAGVGVELRIAGEGPERPALAQLAVRLAVAGRVHLLGHVADVPAFLRELDIFVLPSRSEAHPNALIEGMACGLPCVATRVGGVSEVLDGGRYGRLVELGDAAALTQALADLARDPAARADLGAAARRRVCTRYSLPAMVDAYAGLYRRLSCGRSARDDAACQTSKDRPAVVMLAPLPPLKGGMATVADNLRRSRLADRCHLATLNNGKTTAEGRSFLAGVWAQVRLVGRVLATARRTRARIVHIHTCALFSFWRDTLHMLALRAMGRRVIYHIHDGTFEAFLRDQPPVRRAIIRRSLRMASRVILLSDMARASLELLAPGVAWRVVHNGTAIPPTTGGSRDGAVRFLFLGNLTRRKGAYDLLAATARAREAGFRAEVRLAGGEVQPGDRRALEQAIADAGCQDQVKVLGFLEGPAKDEALLASDCLVLPSYAEGLPMVVLEAMACGLPVIATRIGAVAEAVTDGQEGFLVEVGDVGALADRMSRLARDPQLRKRMSLAARRRAEEEFSLDLMAEKVLAIYQEVLGPAGGPQGG